MKNLFLVSDITIGDAGLDALVAIIGVFLILILITLAVSLLKLVSKEKVEVSKEVKNESKPFSIDQITDEDMMTATLVASIDFYNETKKNARCVSVKEIK